MLPELDKVEISPYLKKTVGAMRQEKRSNWVEAGWAYISQLFECDDILELSGNKRK
jgi:hypothetical protein